MWKSKGAQRRPVHPRTPAHTSCHLTQLQIRLELGEHLRQGAGKLLYPKLHLACYSPECGPGVAEMTRMWDSPQGQKGLK